MLRILAGLILMSSLATSVVAGPPYVTDDAEPTDFHHFEIYLFNQGTHIRGETETESGIDFNYGAGPNLQLTATLPVVVESPEADDSVSGVGNIELAAKYRFLHQSSTGFDVAVFPRIFLPAGSSKTGARHVSLLLPIWMEHDWGSWSTFGGGGCTINRGGDSQDFCQASWALAKMVQPKLQLGAEILHQTADTKGGLATTAFGAGLRYDISDNLHLLAYGNGGVQNSAETDRYSWYGSILFTF